MYAEHKRRRAQSILFAWAILSVALGSIFVPLIGYPLHTLIHGLPPSHFYRECIAFVDTGSRISPACRPGLSRAWLENSRLYYATLPSRWSLWAPVIKDALWPDWPSPTAIVVFFLPLPIPLAAWLRWRRDLRLQGEGGAYFCESRELRRAELFYRSGLVLGRVSRGSGLCGPRYLRNWECLSGLLIAPPGTGKSLTIITNLICDWPDSARIPGPSIFVNDPKGELYSATSGWRKKHGPVFRLAWGESEGDSWNPLDPTSFRNGLMRAPLRNRIMTVLSSWCGRDRACCAMTRLFDLIRDDPGWRARLLKDPSGLVPEPRLAGHDHDDADYFFHAAELKAVRQIRERLAGDMTRSAIEELLRTAEALYAIQCDVEKAIDAMCVILIPDSVEAHWRMTGREALAGFIGFTIARAEARPEFADACHFGALLDWLTTIEGEKPPTADGDLTAKLLDAAIEEARRFAYPRRVVSDLSALRLKPDRERGSVISTAAGAIAIFKNASARRRTSTSTFRSLDARGIRDPKTGRLLPVTVYCVVNASEAEAYGRITGLLIESLAQSLLSEDDRSFARAKTRRETRPVLFLLDEFWTLPPMNALRRIPALGRSMWCSALIVGQSQAQIASKYGADGKNALQELKASSHYQMFFAQNDIETAREVSDLLGQVTVISESQSRQTGFGQGVNPFAANLSEQTKGKPLIRPEEVMRLKKLTPAKRQWGEMIVRFGDLNIRCMPCCPFDDRKLKSRLNL